MIVNRNFELHIQLIDICHFFYFLLLLLLQFYYLYVFVLFHRLIQFSPSILSESIQIFLILVQKLFCFHYPLSHFYVMLPIFPFSFFSIPYFLRQNYHILFLSSLAFENNTKDV